MWCTFMQILYIVFMYFIDNYLDTKINRGQKITTAPDCLPACDLFDR